jgi:hypothetical protein
VRRALTVCLGLLLSFVIGMPSATAGSPHFIASSITVTTSTSSLTVSGKEAGLGDESQVNVVLRGTAECINGGGQHPKAVNKQSVSASGSFPVQNGRANFTLTLTATFQPQCSPPMTVEFVNVTLTDVTNGITLRL